MAEKPSRPPVSGEIITTANAAGSRRETGLACLNDVVDADYETLPSRNAGKSAPPALPVSPTMPVSGLDMLRGEAPATHVPGRTVFWMSVLLVATGVFWISGGYSVFGREADARGQKLSPHILDDAAAINAIFWGQRELTLEMGQCTAFSSHSAVPKEDVASVSVTSQRGKAVE